ncbi:MAG TPA: ARMT1-like domain-containing protein [Tepidisphaeraceae bacterium]
MPAPLVPFVKLKDPSTYRACRWDMRSDHEAREYWIAFFKKHVLTILDLGFRMAVDRGQPTAPVRERMDACVADFHTFFDAVNADPARYPSPDGGPVTILTLDVWRDGLLRKHGFVDPFEDLKQRENEGVIALLPKVCRQHDALKETELFRAVIEGVFAGNIFDMGAAGSAQLLLDGKLDFFETRKKLPARPWLVDGFDAFAAKAERGWKRAVFFVDNAGSDFVLGALPMMRYLAKRGTSVVLAANERPTLNDMTVHDVRAWWPRLMETEPSLADLPIHIVSTGTGEPLIDLMGVSPELNEAAADADLVIMEGMGRGIESNLDAEFSCDAANLAMIKDYMVAKRLNGKLYDVVCRFR